MTKYIIPVLALIAFSCGSNQSETIGEETSAKVISAQDLLDSAQAMNKQGGAQSYEKAIDLIDEAIAKEPDFKAAYMSKISILINMGDYQRLFDCLKTAESKFPQDPYLNLHLGMEYELANDTAKAYPLYVKSLNSFAVVLDTLQNSELKRNSLLMNMAMANVLSPDKLSESDVMIVLSEDEMVNYRTSESTFKEMDRQALLDLRRN
jgi:tetratricopeptide (TPR) repeat protein